MDRNELDELGIVEWSSVASRLEGSDLLLGNGFSLNIWSYFNYSSLFDQFLNTCEDSEKRTFELFDTSNFEFILEDLASAEKVNRIFRIDTTHISSAIQKVRSDGQVLRFL